MVTLKGPTEAVLSCDLQRLLPATDPFSRQIVIGLGCFLEVFALAATHSGHRAQVTLFPEGEPRSRLDTRPIAHLKLMEDEQINEDPLFVHIPNRRTNRNAYDTTHGISQDTLLEITRAAGTSVNVGSLGQGPELETLRTLTKDALRDEILDPRAFQESIDLMRIGRVEIEANPDGIYLGGAFLEALNLVGILTQEKLADPQSDAFQVGLDMADEQAMTSMGFVWISTPGNSRLEQIAAGRSYVRAALSVTSLGLAMQPMSQALQEYTTMQPHYEKVHSLLTDSSGERIQMLARLGYAEEVQPAPRWELTTRIKQ